MRRLIRCARPEGLLVFPSPSTLCPALRRLRRVVPVRTDATPGEGPLIRDELDLMSRYLTDFRIRYYMLFGWLDRFLLVARNYERSAVVRRAAVSLIDLFVYGFMSVPGLRRLAGNYVIYGDPNKAAL